MAKIKGKLTIPSQQSDTHMLLFQQIYAFHQATEVALSQFQNNKSYMDVLRLIRSRFFADSSYARESVNQAWQLFLKRQELGSHQYAMSPSSPSALWNRKNLVLSYIPQGQLFYLTVQLGYYHAEYPEVKGLLVQFNEKTTRELMAYLQYQPNGNYLGVKNIGLVAEENNIYVELDLPVQSRRLQSKVSLAASFLTAVVALHTTTPTLAMAEEINDGFQVAQTAKTMKIVDKTNGKALSGVEIRSEENNQVLATSNADGVFSVTPAITNTLFISVVKPGYKMQLLDTADLEKMGLTIQLENLVANNPTPVKPETGTQPTTKPVTDTTKPADLNELLEKELSERENKNASTTPVTKPVTPPSTKPVTPPVTKPVTPPVTKPNTVATKPVTPPVTKPVTPPVTKPNTVATKPVTPPVTKPVTPPVTKPNTVATKPVTPPVTKPVTPPVTKPNTVATKPVTPPVTKPVTPPVTKPNTVATKPVTPPVTKPVTPPVTKPNTVATKPVTPPATKPATKPIQIAAKPAPVKHHAPAPVQAHSKDGRYVVQPGDSLVKIAEKQLGGGKHWYKLYLANSHKISTGYTIYPGQALQLPMMASQTAHMAAKPQTHKTRDYVVKPGDSLSKIARNHMGHINYWKTLYEMNKGRIKDPTMIYVGQVIKIPG